MATSTEDNVRDTLVNAIKAIAVTKLDFDETSGNVKDYLYDYELEELKSKFLMARSKGKQKIRVWAVQVLAKDNWFTSQNKMSRDYRITIQAHYEIEKDGQGFKDLVAHARKVREAIKNLYSTLSSTVTGVSEIGELNISTISNTDTGEPNIYVGTFEILAFSREPDF